MESMGEKPYKARQLFKWIYGVRQYDFDSMTNLSKALRSRLGEQCCLTGLDLEDLAVSDDGTQKFLFRLQDDQAIESVLIPDEDSGRKTACVSSQAGCALGCVFCATGMLGFKRDLTVGEIIGQLMYLRDRLGADAFTNVVFMGMGEPLLNLQNVLDAIGIISAGSGLSHSARKVTISTCGIAPRIRELADSGCKARLAVSLNAVVQAKRERIMPIARKSPLDDLVEALKYYKSRSRERVTFEYALFDGFNDGMDDVMAIANLIKGIPCKINVLAYNPVDGSSLKRPSDEKVDWFARQLYPRAPAVTVRRSRGTDVSAACGQLAGRAGHRR